MYKIGVLAAVSALTLAACGDVVQFPGAGDVPVKNDSAGNETPTPVAEPAPADVPAPVITPDPSSSETPATNTSPTENVDDGEANTSDTSNTDTTTPTPTAVSGVNSLLEVNAEICAASENQTMTIAEVAGAGDPESNFQVSVVNGTQADRVNFPGIVKLEPKKRIPNTTRTKSGHCAATRIAEQWFITAAHCLDEENDEVTIVTGVNRLNDPTAVRLTAQTTICHSSYGGSAEEYANDIALVKMAPGAIEFMESVPIAEYGLTDKLLGATNYPTVDMAGWGLTSFSESLSNELLQATLKTNNVGPAIISIASIGGSGPCVGDSGGPLYVTEDDGSKVLVGVLSVVENNLSTGKFCEGQYNGRYTNLQGFLPWVDAVIGVCDGEGGDALCVDG